MNLCKRSKLERYRLWQFIEILTDTHIDLTQRLFENIQIRYFVCVFICVLSASCLTPYLASLFLFQKVCVGVSRSAHKKNLIYVFALLWVCVFVFLFFHSLSSPPLLCQCSSLLLAATSPGSTTINHSQHCTNAQMHNWAQFCCCKISIINVFK